MAKAPPEVATTAPTLVTDCSAIVNGTANPNGKTTTFVVQYGPNVSYGLQTPQ